MTNDRKSEAMNDLLQRLRESAIEIASAGHAGWGNVCSNAADEIERLRARAESAERERDALRERIDSAQPAEVLDDFDQMGNRCGIIYVETAQIGKHVRLIVEE